MIETCINEEQFDFIAAEDKQFIIAFTKALESRGYTFDKPIGSGFCWGRYMIIYHKANEKTKKVVARIYIRENSIVLRMFFNKVTNHAEYIGSSCDYIKEVFTGAYGNCKHCKGDNCKFRKDYIIDGVPIEKCNGTTFEFNFPTVDKLPKFIELFNEFYPVK